LHVVAIKPPRHHERQAESSRDEADAIEPGGAIRRAADIEPVRDRLTAAGHADQQTAIGNQKAAGGVLITLEKPSKPMVKEAIDDGRYTAKLYPKEYLCLC